MVSVRAMGGYEARDRNVASQAAAGLVGLYHHTCRKTECRLVGFLDIRASGSLVGASAQIAKAS
jgi:hypothetical protein